jgi:hemolysin activation/secretion protein
VKLSASGIAFRTRPRLLLSAASLSILAAPAAAQTVPGAPRPPTREEVERPLPPAVDRRPRLDVEGGIERAPCALDAEAYRDMRFTLRSVAFGGLKGASAEDLRPAYEPFLGAEHPISVICDIRDRAATILRNAGYVAAIEVPEQRLGEGHLRLEALMARLVAVRVRGDAGRAERTIARYLEKLPGREVFNRFEAERYLLLARDLPGYDARLTLRSANAGPGEVVGEVTVLRRAADVDLNVQNLGSRELGRWGALLRGQLYGLTGLGDRTTLAIFSTADFDEQRTLHVGHDFRVGGEGLSFGGHFTYAWAEPSAGPLDVEARTLLATFEAGYPLLLRESGAIRAGAGLDLIDQRVSVGGIPLSRDRLRVAFARLEFARTDEASLGRLPGFSPAEPRWRVAGRAELRKGLDLLGASEGCGPAFARCLAPGAAGLSRFEGDPTAAVLRFEAQAEYRPIPRLTLGLGVSAQSSGEALLTFEEYSAGNYTIGRGYDPGTLLGDRGAGVQAELRYGSLVPRTVRSLALEPFVFLDAARVWNADRIFPVPGPHSLASVGGGLRALFGEAARLEAVIAVPLKRAGIDNERPDPRFLLSFTARLWPWSLR